jgi:Fic family protein
MGNDRAGTYINQLQGDLSYKAFIPKSLPPNPQILLSPELTRVLSEADRSIGRLDGVIKSIPNPELFVMMYIKKEAVLSSQIEGTQTSLSDILDKEEVFLSAKKNDDVVATLNYIDAMNYGLERIKEFPLSLRLIREIHQRLLTNVRGHAKEPGEFRRNQNWVGPPGCTLKEATYVPPPAHEMNQALDDFEKYLHIEKIYPVLIECGLIHAQFETIHPFSDGNGRIGRLLITFLLCINEVIDRPLLYLSYYFKKNKQEYYNRLMSVRNDGDWEGWLKFFLKGIAETSQNVVELSSKILELKKNKEELVRKSMRKSSLKVIELLDKLYVHPVITVTSASELCDISYNAAKSIIKTFEGLNILEEKSGRKRDRKYYFREYIDMLNEGTTI